MWWVAALPALLALCYLIRPAFFRWYGAQLLPLKCGACGSDFKRARRDFPPEAAMWIPQCPGCAALGMLADGRCPRCSERIHEVINVPDGGVGAAFAPHLCAELSAPVSWLDVMSARRYIAQRHTESIPTTPLENDTMTHDKETR